MFQGCHLLFHWDATWLLILECCSALLLKGWPVGPAAWASFGSLLEMQSLRHQPRPTESESAFLTRSLVIQGFSDSSVGKKATCNAGDPSLMSGSGRSAGEGIRYPLQYSWSSLWLSWKRICLQCGRPGFEPWAGKIPLEKEKATHSSILAWRIPRTV